MSTEYFSSITGSSNAASSSTINNSSNNNACTSTRWLTEEVFALIDLVQRNEAIYNPRHKYYFCRPYVENFWREVDLKLEKNPGASLAKWTNLRISFRREYTNYLEEKVPPCWTYFDRMFFLHPYLRKKHQQSKSLDSQVQDALVQISSLSNRLQRERAVAAAASAAASSLNPQSNNGSPSQPQLDPYLDGYFDDGEPNNSELDDMIDDEPSNPPQHFAHSTLAHDIIKSECEDIADEYDNVERPLDDDDHDADDAEMRNFVLNSLEKRQQQQQQQQQRLQQLQRLQSRAFYEDFRHKRARSHDNISSSQSSSSSLMASSTNHTNNVSFVRPTFAKPLEVVSTTTQSHNNNSSHNNNPSSNTSNNSNSSSASSVINNDLEPVTNSTARLNSSSINNQHHNTTTSSTSASHYSSTSSMSHTQHHHHHQQRFEISAINSTANPLNPTTSSAGSANASSLLTVPAPATPELCDCKTDPDAMFLMSLLPDIQKLNGRDRGKIKIAFQNILQDYLYPD
ncbi:nuclear transcription factor Y subunit gamma isoform X1 [Lucilia cuprina]|uniref:nuclear transcription factor Y subunit gamma isoform X1 n=1 Tax=Lucilia cuprina TaxID=7375 RepID=UPI001F05191E|nr:nuclear transcription factor Y subunit gamma isoform X1 [Lucilia cuprina]